MSSDNNNSSSSDVANVGPTPGAGVDPTKVVRGTNRLKKAYRVYCSRTSESKRLSLRAWAKQAPESELDPEFVVNWELHKSGAHTKGAKAERKAQVRLLQSEKKSSKDDKKR